MRILGIDYGTKRIGLALGDSETRIAAPIETISSENAIDVLQELIKKEAIEEVVIGLPVHRDGAPSSQTKITQSFIDKLKEFILVHTIDERFTSLEGKAMQKEGDSADKDALAALIILEAYFEEHK